MYIDTHCHLSKKYYDNIDKVINDNIDSLIDKIIISGCEKEDFDETIKIINKYSMVYGTLGYHPDQVDVIDNKDIKYLKEIVQLENKIVGIGEIGLDYHYDTTKKEKQKKIFELQLQIAEELSLPVIIHSRDATKDTIDILNKYNLTGIIHCFSGSLETAKVYMKMGYKLGIGGVITFKNSKLSEVIKNIPLNSIVLETDSPYLTPEPYRGKKNSSKYIPLVAEKIAKIKNISLDKISKETTKNCYDLFDLNR